MVSIEKKRSKGNLDVLPVILTALTLFALLVYAFEEDAHPVSATSYKPAMVKLLLEADQNNDNGNDKAPPAADTAQCPYMKMSDLTPEERNPTAGSRHMITPPHGGLMHLVCCDTTKGPLNAVVHEKWAPRGAQRFLNMVQSGYFNAGVPLMRCIQGFLCQFGTNRLREQGHEQSKNHVPSLAPQK